jgi:hypothetical protein
MVGKTYSARDGNRRVYEYGRTLLRSLSRDQRIRDSLSGKTY